MCFQRLRLALGKLGVVGVAGGDAALDDGDAERQRLAGAGARLTNQVGAQEGDGERHLLDGERVDDARPLEAVADLGEHAEVAESGRGRALSGAFGGQCSSLS